MKKRFLQTELVEPTTIETLAKRDKKNKETIPIKLNCRVVLTQPEGHKTRETWLMCLRAVMVC